MPEVTSKGPAPQAVSEPGAARAGELRRYRRACQEVDRLLDQGRLSEAVALNEEVRALFRRLFTDADPGPL